MGLRPGQRCFHFRSCNNGQDPRKEENESEEKPERSQQYSEIDKCRYKYMPAGRQEVLMQGADDDHKTLKPHSYRYAYGNENHPGVAAPDPAYPQQLRD